MCFMNCNRPAESPRDKEEIVKLVYRFNDASVPPDDHRSYTITADSSSVHIIVDSYGEILADTMFSIEKEKFEKIVQVFLDAGIKECSKTEDHSCTGGTSEEISVFDEQKSVINGYISYCGGKSYGTLKGDLRLVGIEMRKIVPDFPALVK